MRTLLLKHYRAHGNQPRMAEQRFTREGGRSKATKTFEDTRVQ